LPAIVNVVRWYSAVVLPLTVVGVPALILSPAIVANSTQPLFLVLGVQLFQEMGGNFYPLKIAAPMPWLLLKYMSAKT
jgi:hypothetical protein